MKPSLLGMLLGCAVQVSLAAGASAQAAATPARPTLGCPGDPHSLPTQEWVRDMRSKDIAGIRNLSSSDIVFLGPDGATYRGRSAVESLYQRVFSTFDSSLTLQPTAHQWDADQHICTETGAYEEDLRTRADGTRQHLRGRYTFAFRPVSQGRWVISKQEWTVATGNLAIP